MKVIRLEVKNFLGIKHVEIEPGQYVVYIEGKNKQGKSSIINFLWSAFGGKKARPERPIREGETEGGGSIDLGDIIVTLKFTEKGEYLDVRNKENMKHGSPQQVLDSLFSAVSFDPKEFVSMRPAQRREILLELTGQKEKIERLETERKQVYDERTNINRTVKNLGERLKALSDDVFEPVEPVSSKGILDKLREEQQRLADLQGKRQQVIDLKADVTARKGEIENNKRRIGEYEQAICDLKTAIGNHNGNIALHEKLIGEIEGLLQAAPADKTAEIEAELGQVEAQNESARLHKAAVELRAEHEKAASESAEMTKAIEDIDRARIEILNNAQLPIDGLALDGELLTINNTPFDDLATSEQYEAAIKIGIATNPKLRVMRINNGSEMDSSQLKQLEALATKHDVQIFVEYVTDGECAIRGYLVEAGEIKQNATPALDLT